ncbi:hypothetical protein BDR07DRAFT_1480160 [Suillus spraguei]|nr:hypothetical protein BDR07DRAFT_1480160 [Suillus spraguei]
MISANFPADRLCLFTVAGDAIPVCNINEHKFLKTERADDQAKAAVVHQCALEMRDSEIHLREAETKMHDALAHAHSEEAELLHLKIEYTRLTSSGSGSGS